MIKKWHFVIFWHDQKIQKWSFLDFLIMSKTHFWIFGWDPKIQKMGFWPFFGFLDRPKIQKGGRGYPLGYPHGSWGVPPWPKMVQRTIFWLKMVWGPFFDKNLLLFFSFRNLDMSPKMKMAKMAQNPKKAPPKRLIGARNEKAKITTKKTKHPPAKKQIPHTKKNRPSTPTQNDTNARKRKSPRKRHQNHPPGVVLDPKPPAHAKQRSQTQKRTQNRHKNAQKGTKSPKVT